MMIEMLVRYNVGDEGHYFGDDGDYDVQDDDDDDEDRNDDQRMKIPTVMNLIMLIIMMNDDYVADLDEDDDGR